MGTGSVILLRITVDVTNREVFERTYLDILRAKQFLLSPFNREMFKFD